MQNPSILPAKTPAITTGLLALCTLVLCGCHDGPLYALKHANPYFTMKEWREDKEFGVTDHERRNQMITLADQIEDMPQKRQVFWSGHLNKIIDTDPSAEMRRLAVNAAGKLRTASALPLIQKGLDDESIKVRMEACRSLGRRREPQATQLLAKTVGGESDQDVQHAAIAALSKHKTSVSMDSLGIALRDRNPATRKLAINSLRKVTGKDYGDNADRWIAAMTRPTGPVRDADEMIAQAPATSSKSLDLPDFLRDGPPKTAQDTSPSASPLISDAGSNPTAAPANPAPVAPTEIKLPDAWNPDQPSSQSAPSLFR